MNISIIMVKKRVQSIDISIIKHLFTGCEWKSYLIQPLTETIPSQTSPRGIIPGLKVEPFTTIK